MPHKLITIPCLANNYAFLLHDSQSGTTALIDAPEAAPIEAMLQKQGWSLSYILLTHHHSDHIDGVPELLKNHSAQVIGARADSHRLPPLDVMVGEGDIIHIGALQGQVIEVPGHTVGHIAFHFPDADVLFSGDSLMSMGCGRLFEGTPAQMWDSLQKMVCLPAHTRVASGHEYTQTNIQFIRSLGYKDAQLESYAEQVDALRKQGLPTIPSILSIERAVNPFLAPGDSKIRQALQSDNDSVIEIFTNLRLKRDKF